MSRSARAGKQDQTPDNHAITVRRPSVHLLRPMVGPILSDIVAGAGKAYDTEPGQQLWGSFTMLCTMSAAVRSETDYAVLALVVFSACHCLWVGEAAGIHRANINPPRWPSNDGCAAHGVSSGNKPW